MSILTINLEEKLVKEKTKKIAEFAKQSNNGADILAVTHQILDDSTKEDLEALKRAGLSNAVKEVQQIRDNKKKIEEKRHNLQDNPRIFTIDEIESIAVRYGLRFLSSPFYKGNLPNDLGLKIKEFESKFPKEREKYDYQIGAFRIDCYILAPKESFNLQSRPIDPLMFAKLSDGTFYLIHKWGNDLNISRWFFNLPMRNWFNLFLTISLGLSGLILWFIHKFTEEGIIFRHFKMSECNDKAWNEVSCEGHYYLFWIIPLISMVISFFLVSMTSYECNDNKWNSQFKD